MNPYTGPYLSTPCAVRTCRHPYNWHVPGGVCQSPICQCIAYAQPTKETPMPDTPIRAVIYLPHPQKWITPPYIDRLTELRDYVQGAGYTLLGAVTIHHPEDPWDEPDERWILRRKLEEGRIDVLVTWDTEKGGPTSLLRPKAPCKHVWVTALDGDDQPARDSQGNTWTHCGLCGTHQDDQTPPVGGYKVGEIVFYDDAPGTVKDRVYNEKRGGWDCIVAFDGAPEGVTGTVWESDLTPGDEGLE